jgi:curli biogenesis system outer membrane secretion channel CsgG
MPKSGAIGISRGSGCAIGWSGGEKVEQQIPRLTQIEMRSETTMRRKIHLFILAIGLAGAAGQGAPQTKPAGSKGNPQVDAVIEMVKAGLSEGFIVKKLVKDNKPVVLTADDMVKLKQAGVSENIMSAMMDPTSAAAAPAASVAPTPAAQPAPPAPDPPAPAPRAVDLPPVTVAVSAPVAVVPASAPSGNAAKKRVVVDPFDYSAVMTQITQAYGNQQNIGAGIQAMLVTRITESGKLVVLERKKLQQIKDEQDMGLGGRNQQGSGARVGRLKGADAILAGDITVFGRDDKNIGGRGGECKSWDFKCKAMGGGVQLNKAVVAINYRLVDAETGEVIATGEARGEKKKTSLGGGGGESSYWGNSKGGNFSMTSSNFAESMVGQATQDCVNKLADILNDQATNMKRTVREVEASVADVDGNTIIIGRGSDDGVSTGEIFDIHQILKIIKDPQTQEVLDRKTQPIGQLTIISVRAKVATGTYVGSTPPADLKSLVAIKRLPAQ